MGQVVLAVARRHGSRLAAADVGERERHRERKVARLSLEPRDRRAPEPVVAVQRGEQLSGRAGRHHDPRLQGLQDPLHPRRRVAEVYGGVGAIRLEDAQHRGDRARRLRHEQRDAVSAPAPPRDERARQLVTHLLQRAVTDPLGPEYDRGGVGTALGLARDPVLQSRHACDTEADARAITVPICENSSADAGTS